MEREPSGPSPRDFAANTFLPSACFSCKLFGRRVLLLLFFFSHSPFSSFLFMFCFVL